MKHLFNFFFVVLIIPAINFGQVTLDRADNCSSLKLKVPPEKFAKGDQIVNLESKTSEGVWTKFRRVNLEYFEFNFENLPNGEYRTTVLNNSHYGSSKLRNSNISNSVNLNCEERSNLKISNLIVHPNPTSSTLNIDYIIPEKNTLKYEIIDLAGVLICYGDLNSREIDVSPLNNGKYFVTIIDSSGVVSVGSFLILKN